MAALVVAIAAMPAAAAGLAPADASRAVGSFEDVSMAEEKTPVHADAVLDLAEDLQKQTGSGSVADALTAAQQVTAHHAEQMNLPAPASVDAPAHDTPSTALTSVVATLGGELTTEQTQDAAELDTLPTSVADALTDLLDAYHAYAIAAHAAFAPADLAVLDDTSTAEITSPVAAYEALGVDPVDVATVLAERNTLLDATADLESALDDAPSLTTTASSHPGIDIPPYVGIDLSFGSDTYLENYHLLVDVGGSDTYLNNAGGSMIGNCDLTIYGAALVDLGFGADRFSVYQGSNDWRGDACGKNGGAHGPSAGLLVNGDNDDDLYGDDQTWPLSGFHQGVNGGGYNGGQGLLVDTGGHDTYNADNHGTNGGASQLGATGILVDGAGADDYIATSHGTNGGGHNTGHGALVQLGATTTLPPLADADHLQAEHTGTNGGGAYTGSGLAIDTSPRNTVYEATEQGTNGGGYNTGTGALVDLLGSDTYNADSYGTNGGADNTGTGLLYDADGNDDYTAWSNGVNGGSSGGAALLLDTGGADTFDEASGSCSDPGSCTIVPKGIAGARITI